MGLSAVIFVAFFVSAEIFSVDAFCRRPYDFPDWESKTLAKRAEAVDIVVYGNVTASPCKKPPPTKAPTTALPTTPANATQGNSTQGNSTQGNSTQVSSTAAPATPEIKSNSSSHSPESSDSSYNCSSAFYNVTVKVFCVIKGGHLPEILHLEKFGLGEEMCVHPNETIHQFHAYEGLNYVFFLGRHEVVNGSSGFWIHTVNEQPAASEISEESDLEAIFEAAGKHAHAPLGVWSNQTHDICEPYESGAEPGPISAHVTFLLSLATLASVTFMS